MQSLNIIWSILLLLPLATSAQDEGFSSQPQKRDEYALVLYVGSGPGYYLSVAGVPDYLRPDVNKLSAVSTVRVMWHPDHLVKVGLETGFMRFVSYTLEDSVGNKGKVQLHAIPLLVEYTMAVTKRINLFAGSGVYFLRTDLEYKGESSASKLSVGWMAAASYIHPLGKRTGLGAELKWMDAAESTDGSLSLQIQLVWKFLTW